MHRSFTLFSVNPSLFGKIHPFFVNSFFVWQKPFFVAVIGTAVILMKPFGIRKASDGAGKTTIGVTIVVRRGAHARTTTDPGTSGQEDTFTILVIAIPA